MGGDGEGETDIHSGRIIFDRRVKKFFYSGKFNNLVKFFRHFISCHSEYGAVQKYVFPSGKFRMKSRADFKKTGNSSVYSYLACRRRSDLRKNFEKGGFDGAVRADYDHHFASLNFQIYVLKRPEFFFCFYANDLF